MLLVGQKFKYRKFFSNIIDLAIFAIPNVMS